MAFDYPNAGKNAPEGVREFIEEFRRRPERQRRRLPLLYEILGTGTPKYKLDKADVRYTDKSTTKGQKCGNCDHAYAKVVVPGRYICSWIRGKIKPAGWCDRWVPPKKR